MDDSISGMEKSAGVRQGPGRRSDFPVGVADTGMLHFFPELVRQLGGDPDILLRNNGIEPETLSKRGVWLEYRRVVALLQHSAEALGCPDFGMRLAATQDRSRAFGPIGVVMKNCGTVGDALGYAIENVQSYAIGMAVRLGCFSPGYQALSIDLIVEGFLDKRQAIERTLLLSALNLTDMSGGLVRVKRVLFTHRPVAPLEIYRDRFGCEVSFGQRMDALIVSDADLCQPIPNPDEMLYEMASSFIASRFPHRQAPLHALARALILRYLASADCTNERIAAELKLHPRTLQRRLRAEGTSFDALKDEARRDVAWHYIKESTLPMSQLAEKLGYAEASVLSRSCYRWFSVSPRKLRVKARRDLLPAEGV